MTTRDIRRRQSAYFFKRNHLYSLQVNYMKNVAVTVAAAALLGGGLSAQQTAKPASGRAPVSAPKLATAHSASGLTVESQNQLVGQYCATCHSERGKAGGLTLAGFDAVKISERPEVAEKMI